MNTPRRTPNSSPVSFEPTSINNSLTQIKDLLSDVSIRLATLERAEIKRRDKERTQELKAAQDGKISPAQGYGMFDR